MKIQCHKCQHVWNYKGDSDYYVTCPHCYRKIKSLKIKGDLNTDDKQSVDDSNDQTKGGNENGNTKYESRSQP